MTCLQKNDNTNKGIKRLTILRLINSWPNWVTTNCHLTLGRISGNLHICCLDIAVACDERGTRVWPTIVDWRWRYTTSFIGWTLLKEMSISSVWQSTGVCTDRHLGTSPTTSSQPLTLLRAVVVYDLPTWTVSRYLAVDLARMAVGLFITLARQSGTRCQMNLEI